ncbi:long-chain fatty acid--CoA ligase [Mycolicibacterium sp. CH28]|uniref:class I adenylate-forming enzyme family protein n=1 Tax=Mycolicibacterium sp. CH28 TaxID=2512237 RepID=UPI0010801914|nr:class I adenylate-forming enzyme family protein [Mycolicibacterium sp. CH28]TGD84346.1 long-chain fatty acid--CoA ligase [Mycolicibacterium sp. CH28]
MTRSGHPYGPSRIATLDGIADVLAATVPDTLRAAAQTDAALYIVGDREYSMSEILDGVEARARGLVQAGFAPGERLGVWLPNGIDCVLWTYAAIVAGGSAVMIPSRAPATEAGRVSRVAGARWVIGPADLADTSISEQTAQRRFLGGSTSVALPERAPGDEAVCFTTSGSTGVAKLCALSDRSWAVQVINAQAASGGSVDETMLAMLPMCHSAFLPNVHANLVQGRRVVQVPKFDAREVLRIAAEERTRYVSGSPTMFGLMLRRGDWPNTALRFRRISYGSAAMPAHWADELSGTFGCEVVHGYGLTEASGWVSIEQPADRRDGSVGSLMPGHTDLVTVDVDGRRCAPGEEGEICVRGPGQMLAYLGLPEETQETLRGGFVHTGDLGRLDDSGHLWITGRIKDQINRGGLKIGAREVESVIESLTGVTGVAVVAVPDDVLGERVAAMVETAAHTPSDIRTHIAHALADYKVPDLVVVVGELPRNHMGKPNKADIRRDMVRTARTGK